MSSLIGQNVTLFLEQHQSKINSRGGKIPVFKAQVTPQLRNSSIFTKKFYGKSLRSCIVRKDFMATQRFSFVARAVLTTDTASQQARKFNLDGDIELQVAVSPMSSGCKVEIQVTNSHNDNMILHWGAIRDTKEKWVLPSRRPEGTKVHKDRALRTPFQKSGNGSFLKIEIDDPALQAIEFLVFNEARNIWFKNNGENFHVRLPVKSENLQNVTVPEDLVQIQAYLRWERNGKQMYNPEKEKEEYEAARAELVEEVARGASIQEIRARLTKGSGENEVKEPTAKGEVQTKVKKQPEKKRHFTVDRIQRKKRDLMQLINKYAAAEPKEEREKSREEKTSQPKSLSTVELFAEAKEAQDGGDVVKKKIYEIANKQLLVLVTKLDDKTKIRLATDFKEPLTLHWALSRKGQGHEWLAPPPNVLPHGSVSLEKAAETEFTSIPLDDPLHELQVQSIEVEIEGDDFVGMPFVLVSAGNWIKDKGSDFYVELGVKEKQRDAGDGSGTAKSVLEKIASLESEAQKSFMHRFNIAADLLDEALNAGELGLAGILVWMRFMATRQLIWNKNYNVKPR